jgi:hypothetical protein
VNNQAHMVDPFECPAASRDEVIGDALSSVYDAGATRVPPWAAVVATLATVRPDGIGDVVDWLVEHRADLERAYLAGGTAKLAPAAVPVGMQYQPELGALERRRNDHALRDRYLFADVVEQQSFTQTTVYAITGIQISAREADMLDQLANSTMVVDRRAWPMAATRRIAARGGDYAAAVVGGLAMMGAPMLAGAAAASCARFLQRVRASDRPPADVVAESLARRERVMGFGRPVVGPDERVPIMRGILERYGRAELPFVSTLRAVEEAFVTQKGLATTAAAWAAAALLDFGMTPDGIHAISNHWVTVCVHAQALFSAERGVQ